MTLKTKQSMLPYFLCPNCKFTWIFQENFKNPLDKVNLKIYCYQRWKQQAQKKLTAKWSVAASELRQKDEISDYDFMVSINKFVSDTVKMYGAASEENKALFPTNRQKGEIIGKCPRCGGNISESKKGFFCDGNECKFAFWRDNKFFTLKKKAITKEIAQTLLNEGRIFMQGLASEKTGKTYNATIILDDKGEGYPGFTMEFEKK